MESNNYKPNCLPAKSRYNETTTVRRHARTSTQAAAMEGSLFDFSRPGRVFSYERS